MLLKRSGFVFGSVAATLLVFGGCGTTKPKNEPKWVQSPEEKNTAEEEEDLETIRTVKAVKAPEYVKGVSHEAQDAFRQGVQMAHEVPPRYEEGLGKFEEAIKLDSTFMEPYFNIAMVHERERRCSMKRSKVQ